MRNAVYVAWLDSSVNNSQVDPEDLPKPAVLHTVGWLAHDDADYLVIARDDSPDPGTYKWRSTLAIPRGALITTQTIEIVGGAS